MSLTDLFGDLPDDLPPQDRFPINSSPDRQVSRPVEQDLKNSPDPLIITGYTSLSMLIEFLAARREAPAISGRVRLFLGHEPTLSPQLEFRSARHRFSQEVTDYWLEQGVSIMLCAKLLAVIEMLKQGVIETRISAETGRPVHAKIYQTAQAITLGSSNFSRFGFQAQTEANARFLKQDEPERYAEARQVAEYIWTLGASYDLKQLLEKLLQNVTWQEALARACAEVLEGDWAKRYLPRSAGNSRHALWPSQEQGIAQAMWVIENVGSVLIADATGSGKTRMAAHLMRSIADHIIRTGRGRHDLHTLLSPPGVCEAWEDEARDCGLNFTAYSSGILSSKQSRAHESTRAAIRRSQILVVDEAHNYFSRTSQRTQAVLQSVADYVLLLTATPINRGAYDLLAVVDLLGADNLDDTVVDILKPLWRHRGELDDTMSPLQKETLQRAIQQFTVRRTKTMLNGLVTQEPERYTDRNGRQCRYPRNEMKEYPCHETDRDREIATEIRARADCLRGIINLQKCLRLSEAQRTDKLTPHDYLRWRLLGAKGLAGYAVMASLRSSRAALLQHLRGADYAADFLGYTPAKARKTGNIISRIREGASAPPGHELEIAVPDWLTDPAAYRDACEQEAETYERIVSLCEQLSPAREEAKAALLDRLLEDNNLVLAFDHYPVTLDYLMSCIKAKSAHQVFAATGENPSEQAHISRLFAHGSAQTKTIALCSDAMSEGRNLQAASVIVHLDMPTVVRQAEQRIGRIDRMDSEHRVIQSYWPDDAHEFKLRADERFHARHRFVAELIGSNIELPREVITPQIMQQELARGEPADELEDAFAPLRHLISGDSRLVPEDTYKKIQHSTARVVSSVCAVKSSSAWAFFAVAGTEWGAPRWVYMSNPKDRPETDLNKIALCLREHLTPDPPPHTLDEPAVSLLSRFVAHLAGTEELLLPKKKQRALSEMRVILEAYQKNARVAKDNPRLTLVKELLELLSPRSHHSIDLARLAERWLDVIRPVWYEHLQHQKRAEPLRLRHIRADLLSGHCLTNDALQNVLDAVCPVKPLPDRVVAAIIGVP